MKIYKITNGNTAFRLSGSTQVIYPGQILEISEAIYLKNQVTISRARPRKIETIESVWTGNYVIPSYESRIFYDASSVVASATITLPSLPEDGQQVQVFFGGTLATGEPVVTALAFTGPGTLGIIGQLPTYAISGMSIQFVYNSQLNSWYVTNVTGDVVKTSERVTASGNATISNFTRHFFYDPGLLQSTATITLPAKLYDGQDLTINFGGTIASGSNVVTTLTITAASPATGIIGSVPTAAVSGVPLKLRYAAASGKWFAQ